MPALIIETSGPIAWIALIDQKVIRKVMILDHAPTLSMHLHEALTELFLIVSPHQLDYIGVGIGPGSYAGSRTAATVAKTLSFALDKPLIDFPSPIGFIPAAYEGLFGQTFAYIADAKMGQWALFLGREREGAIELTPFILLAKDALPPYLAGIDLVISETPPHTAPEVCPQRAAAYTHKKFLQGERLSADDLKILYYR